MDFVVIIEEDDKGVAKVFVSKNIDGGRKITVEITDLIKGANPALKILKGINKHQTEIDKLLDVTKLFDKD
jgi:hypothetical protein